MKQASYQYVNLHIISQLVQCNENKSSSVRPFLVVGFCKKSDINSITYKQKQPPEALYKKTVLKNFAISTGKHVCLSLFLINLQAFRPASLLKRDSNTGLFLSILRNF